MIRRSSESSAPMKFLAALIIEAGVDFLYFLDMNLVQGSSNPIARRQDSRDKRSIQIVSPGSLTITNRHLSQLKLLNKIRATYMSEFVRTRRTIIKKKFKINPP
jgi:hypothetical protein